MIVIVPEWLNGEPTGVVHRVHLPSVSEKGFYRQSVSYTAFNKAMCLLVYGKVPPPIWYSPQWEEEWECKMETERHLKEQYNMEPPTRTFIDHCSIWEFYKAIQWDFKKKRFLS